MDDDDPRLSYSILVADDGRYTVGLTQHDVGYGEYKLRKSAETAYALYMQFLSHPVGHTPSADKWKLWQEFLTIKQERGMLI